MFRLKFLIIRLISDILIYGAIIKAFQWGFGLWIRITGMTTVVINLIIACIAAAGVNYFVTKLKETVFFIMKCVTIESIVDEEPSFLKCLGYVTNDWKTTFAIPPINAALRKILHSLAKKCSENDVPEFLQPFVSPVVENFLTPLRERSEGKSLILKWLESLVRTRIIRLFDYADECVMAWCYKHDDTLLEGCLSGLSVFLKNSVKLLAYIVPITLVEDILKYILIGSMAWYYFFRIGFSFDTVVYFYLIVCAAVYALKDAILEPMTMDSVIKKYCAYCNDEDPDTLVSNIQDVADTGELESLLGRRHGNGGSQDGNIDDSQQGVEEEWVD